MCTNLCVVRNKATGGTATYTMLLGLSFLLRVICFLYSLEEVDNDLGETIGETIQYRQAMTRKCRREMYLFIY